MNLAAHYSVPGYYSMRGLRGLGQATRGEQLGVSIGETAGTAAATAAISSANAAAVAAGTSFSFLGMGATVAIPVVGAAIAAVGIAIMAILNSGCGQTCIETSQWANQAEPLLQQNVVAYFAIPAPRPKSVQAAAVQNFMNVWNRLVALCSQPGLGAAGQNCISDRQSGACKWKASATGAYPGQPVQGACWNWWNGYHDPIANDSQVYDDSQTSLVATTGGAGATGTTGATGTVASTGSGMDLVMIGGVVLAALFAVSQL